MTRKLLLLCTLLASLAHGCADHSCGASSGSGCGRPTVETLVVTGFWPLAGGAKHKEAEYASWIRNFALLRTPTLVFCDPKAEAQLRGAWALSDAAVSFVPLALDDFHVSTSTRVDWEQQLRLDPELGLHSERLYKVWLERPALMLRALELFPAYTHFFWLDIGIFRDVVPQPGELYLDDAVAACAGSDVVTMLEIEPFTDGDFELVDGLPRIARTAPRMPERISGGQFFGDAPALRLLALGFYAMAQQMADANIFMGKDQNVYAALYAGGDGRKLIHLLPPDGIGDPWWTFPRMLTSATGHPVCPLTPPTARRTVENASLHLSFRQCWTLGQSNYDMPGWDVIMKRLDVSPAPAVVVEVGGSIGEDASEYVRRYSPFLVVFEPQDTSFSVLESKFAGNPRVLLLPYGISAQNSTLSLCGDEGSASAFGSCASPATVIIQDAKSSFASIERWLHAVGSSPLANSNALISINCEGCEYELLETLIEHDLLRLFRTIQFSRHGRNYFDIDVPDCVPRYCRAQEIMQRTHSIDWVHPWMWERWTRIVNVSPSVANTTPSCSAAGGVCLSAPTPPSAPISLSAAHNESVAQLFALAEAYRALQTPEALRRALPYAWAAAQLAPFVPGAIAREARLARHNAELLFSLTAHHSGLEAHGRRSAELLARLLSDAAVSRGHSRAARSNAEFLLEQAVSRGWPEDGLWTRLLASLVTSQPQCTHERIVLEPDDASGGLCVGMAEVVVIALPHRIAHADAFVRSLGCRSYVRFDAATSPVPSERYAAVTLPNRAYLTAGVTRLYTAYASCVLPFVAALPAGARVGIFEDDVELVAASELPRVAADMRRLLAVGGADSSAFYFFGTCFDQECNMPERMLSVHDPSLVQMRRPFRCMHAFAATPAAAAKALRLLGAETNSTLVINEAIDEAISGFVEQGALTAFAFKPSLLDQTVAADSNNPDVSALAYACDELMRHGAWPTPPAPPPAPALRSQADRLIVTPYLSAELGNQLFMMAAACSFAEALGAGAQCAMHSRGIAPSPHAGGGSYAGSVFRHFGVTDLAPDVKYEEPVFAANLHLPPTTSLPRGVSHLQLFGYFQHEAYVPPGFASRLWLPPVQARPRTAFVHARRGDFVGSPRFDVGLSGEVGGYFDRSMALLREKHAQAGLHGLRFLVFLDDVGWASRQPAFFAPDVDFYVAPPGEDDELHALAAMAQCEAGGVGSNSSFSWWAAFLNANPNRTVVFPSAWYGDGDSLVDDTPFHGSFRVPVKAGGGETTRVDREGAPWRRLGL